MPSVPFAEASRITSLSSHEYTAYVHPDYCYGPAANGGYAGALLWKAVATHFSTTLAKSNQPDTITFHVEFLLPVTVGDVTISIQDVRLGKVSSTVNVTLTQGGKQRVGAYFTNVNRDKAKGITNPIGLSSLDALDPPVPPVNHSALLNHSDPNWTHFRIPYVHPSANKCLSNIIFAMQKTPCEDKSITQMWLGLTNPSERWTMDNLPIGCDMYVPALENFYDSDRNVQHFAAMAQTQLWQEGGMQATEWNQPRWYTTVNMSVDVKRVLPAEGCKWLFTRMKTNEVVDGRLDVQGWIWDEEGRLVALAQYVWFVVETSRAVITKAAKEEKSKI